MYKIIYFFKGSGHQQIKMFKEEEEAKKYLNYLKKDKEIKGVSIEQIGG